MWDYLKTPPFLTRQAWAATLLADCPVVVDVGCWTSPLSAIMDPTIRFIEIDPLIDNPGTNGNVTRHACTLDRVPVPAEPYGLCALGLEHTTIDPVLATWINRATRSVLEFAVGDWPHPAKAWQVLLPQIAVPCVFDCTIDYSNHRYPVHGGYPPRYTRRLLCYGSTPPVFLRLGA